MSRQIWKYKVGILLAALLLDGALLGTMIGIVNTTGAGYMAVSNDGDAPHALPDGITDGITDNMKADAARQKIVALTFDDGPHEVYTAKLLDGLKARGVPATFFLMGENITGNEALVQRMKEEGHLIGNHSYRHIQLTKAGEDAVCQAVEQTEEMIADITGSRPEYLRPPYGDWNENLECRMNLTTVFWTVDSMDWKLKNTARVVQRVEKDVKEGDIILMHDIFPTSVDAALQLVDNLQAKGYTFVTVDELLID